MPSMTRTAAIPCPSWRASTALGSDVVRLPMSSFLSLVR